uniref:Uncharacterized protein n=1 Tax=Rhizophora mucronata TaxID=61149 RepID=A0A2P2MZI2_RHIMU
MARVIWIPRFENWEY